MKSDRKRPRRRSPIPPPSRVIGKTSYDRAAERAALERDLEEYRRTQEQKVARIVITAADVRALVELNDSSTARRLLEVLPIDSTARVWGDEVYFEIPMHHQPENPQADVPPGTVAFWPDGDCLCVFFGQKPYSPVNVVGATLGDPAEFARVREGDAVRVELSEAGT